MSITHLVLLFCFLGPAAWPQTQSAAGVVPGIAATVAVAGEPAQMVTGTSTIRAAAIAHVLKIHALGASGCTLNAAISPSDTAITLNKLSFDPHAKVQSLSAGMGLLMGGEVGLIVSTSPLTVQRGALDTVAVAHDKESPVIILRYGSLSDWLSAQVASILALPIHATLTPQQVAAGADPTAGQITIGAVTK